jgi:PAS domain S-box-containing protein
MPVKRSHNIRAPGTRKGDLVHLRAKELLESFPAGAALIAPNTAVVAMNSRMAQDVGNVDGRPCYEVLAGLTSYCPFCPFEDMVSGVAGPIARAIQERYGKLCSVDVRLLAQSGTDGLILEFVHGLNAPARIVDWEMKTGEPHSYASKKLIGLLAVSKDLIGNAPFDDKMANVLEHVGASLDEALAASVWAEVDDRLYGAPPGKPVTQIKERVIEVDGMPRGRLYAACPTPECLPPEDEYVLEEAADLIGRQIEINDLEAQVRQSEERYKKLAANLAKEIWTRTEALAKETGYLEGILRCSDDMIITTDLDQRIVEFNPAAERILGYAAEEMQGRRITDVWINAAERDKVLEEITISGGIRNYETQLKAKSGEIKEISLTLSLLSDEEGRIIGTVGVSKDIGRELGIKRELELLNRNYRETIHFISHETKNSLIVIGGFVRRLLESETQPERAEQLRIVYHHARFLEAMSRDFLVMAELEHGEFQVRKRRIANCYEEVILPAMVGLKERYPDSFESYDASMGGVGAIQLHGDPALLEVVYRNLFGNALKYRYQGGKIAYGVVDKGDCYVFNVWNEGPGVARGEVEKIFDKFYRVQDETTRDKRGTGLGLYNIRKIVEAHGGRIWCETEPGKWINFLFTLPKK